MPFGPFRRRERVRREAAAWFARLREPAPGDRDAFERWRQDDQEHAAAFDRVRATWEQAGRIQELPLARERGFAEPVGAPGRAGPRYAMAAVAVAVLGVTGTFIATHERPAAPARFMLVSTAVGEIRAVSLDPGTRLTLDTDSAAEVDVDAASRRVRLTRGRARFEVARRRRPLVVLAGAGMITAPAGTFDVLLREDGARVSAVRGSVTVAQAPTREAGRAGQRVEVRAGQATSYGQDGAPDPATTAKTDALWPTGRLEFDDAPLADVVADANRYSRVKVGIADAETGRLRVTGVFRTGDAEAFARTLGAAFGLRVGRAADGTPRLAPAPG